MKKRMKYETEKIISFLQKSPQVPRGKQRFMDQPSNRHVFTFRVHGSRSVTVII